MQFRRNTEIQIEKKVAHFKVKIVKDICILHHGSKTHFTVSSEVVCIS